MSFLSYNLQYYDTALREFENASPTAERVYFAKQLLKFAEDIADEGYTALSDTFCAPRISENLKRYPQFENTVRNLLSEIQTEKITVVESGCYGTFPLLLCALDERVDVRMFTAIPMLFDTYGEKLFTRAYEKIRAFETLVSQDMLMQYADFEGDRFFVKMCIDGEIIEKSNQEIKEMLSGEE